MLNYLAQLISKRNIKQNSFNRLSHREIDPQFRNYETVSNTLFQCMLKASMDSQQEPDFAINEVEDASMSLNVPSSTGPDLLPPDIFQNAGRGFFVFLTVVLNTVKNKLWVPPEWYELIIVTLFKNKGSRKKLEYYRGIFLSNIITKIMEKLIKSRIKTQLKKVNLLQAGSREERSTCDSMFLLRHID